MCVRGEGGGRGTGDEQVGQRQQCIWLQKALRTTDHHLHDRGAAAQFPIFNASTFTHAVLEHPMQHKDRARCHSPLPKSARISALLGLNTPAGVLTNCRGMDGGVVVRGIEIGWVYIAWQQ